MFPAPPRCRCSSPRRTSACASAGASLVPSPAIATMRPLLLFAWRIGASLRSGVASARKSSTPASWAPPNRQRVVAGDHHDRPDPHRAGFVEALLHAHLDGVLEADDAQHAGSPRRPRAACRRGGLIRLTAGVRRHDAALVAHPLRRRTSAAPLRSWCCPGSRDIRVVAGTPPTRRCRAPRGAGAPAELPANTTMERPRASRRTAGQLRGVGKLMSR